FAGLPGVIAKREHSRPFLVTEHGVWVRERYISISSGPFTYFGKGFLMRLSSLVARLNYHHADVVSPVASFNMRWEVPYGAGLEDTFELAGHHSKPTELYAEGDISVLSSISEGFPYTVLESMACGRPVVATDVGGVREALDGYGIVVPPRNHRALGEGIALLL